MHLYRNRNFEKIIVVNIFTYLQLFSDTLNIYFNTIYNFQVRIYIWDYI